MKTASNLQQELNLINGTFIVEDEEFGFKVTLQKRINSEQILAHVAHFETDSINLPDLPAKIHATFLAKERAESYIPITIG